MKTALLTVDAAEAVASVRDRLRSDAQRLRVELVTEPPDCTAPGKHRTCQLRTSILDLEDAVGRCNQVLALAA